MIGSSASRPAPTWSTWPECCRLLVTGATFHTSIRVALVVGTILSVVNQVTVMVGGDATTATWVRVAFNYLVPDAVSGSGYLAPFRVERSGDGSEI